MSVWSQYQDMLGQAYGRRPGWDPPDPWPPVPPEPDGGGGGGKPGDEEDPWEAILEEFRNALALYTSDPSYFLEGYEGGWGNPFANWMRSQQDFLEQLFTEQYMTAPGTGPGGLPEYTPEDFFSQYDFETMWRMSAPPGSAGIPRMPAVVSRRVR